MSCPSESMKSFLIRDIPWGMAVALHVAWRACGTLAGRGAMLYKYLLGCAACWAWRVPPASWVQGMLLERGPSTPLGINTFLCAAFQQFHPLGFGLRHPVLIPGPWGCDSGCMRHVLGRESWGCEAWRYRALGGQ